MDRTEIMQLMLYLQHENEANPEIQRGLELEDDLIHDQSEVRARMKKEQ